MAKIKVSAKQWESLKVWYDNDYCIEAVKRNGYALQYVKEQFLDIEIEKNPVKGGER